LINASIDKAPSTGKINSVDVDSYKVVTTLSKTGPNALPESFPKEVFNPRPRVFTDLNRAAELVTPGERREDVPPYLAEGMCNQRSHTAGGGLNGLNPVNEHSVPPGSLRGTCSTLSVDLHGTGKSANSQGVRAKAF
jgi:hypothetical protein